MSDRDGGSFREEWAQFRSYVRDHGPRKVAREIADVVGANRLPVYASAISFQGVTALVPLALAAVALIGLLDLAELWRQDLAPEVRDRLSGEAFTVLDRTVERILGTQRGFWLTIGVAIALWQVSGAVRAVMAALGDVYERQEERSLGERIPLSLGLAVVVSLGLLAAAAAVQVGPWLAGLAGEGALVTVASFLLRWGLVVVLLGLVIGVLIRSTPGGGGSVSWIGSTSLGIMGAWIAVSLLYGAWIRYFASYGSVYGGLAVVIVTTTYVYLSTFVFLLGVQVDALVRRHAASERM